MGRQDRLRPLWRHYNQNTQGLIFVVDCNDTTRIDEAKAELTKVMDEDELRNACVLVLANKQDLPNAVGPEALADRLGLQKGNRGHLWKVQGCCAATGEGLFEGLEWLATHVSKQ